MVGAKVSSEAEAFTDLIDRRIPVADQVYEILREMIISLALKPGASLTEQMITEMLSVSRTPARTAISRLEQDGFLEVFPQQGTFVSLISLQRVLEGHFIRRAVEVGLIEAAAKNWNSSAAAEMKGCIDNQKKCMREGDYREFQRWDEQFHQAIASCAGMPGCWDIIRPVKDHIDRVRYLAAPMSGHMRMVIREHREILDLLVKGEAEQAKSSLLSHLDKVYDTLDKLKENYPEYFVQNKTPKSRSRYS